MTNKKSSHHRIVAIEVHRSHLVLAIAQREGADAKRHVRCRSVAWRYDATSLATEQGVREMAAALSKLAAQEKLAGQRIALTLSGDYCVTRVVTGSGDYVRRELERLSERVPLYLGLGLGRKLVSQAVTPLDARHQHALLTVTNQQAIASLLTAAAHARLEIEYVESSLVALARAVNQSAESPNEPAIIVHLGEANCELGIALGDRVLLDYRPAGAKQGDIAGVIAGHLQRLQKYFDRHYRLSFGKLGKVYLSGNSQAVHEAQRHFARHKELNCQILYPSQINPQWSVAFESTDGAVPTEGCAALGTCLALTQPAHQRASFNLISSLLAARREPLRPLLVRTFWPAAAALLVAISLFAAGQLQELTNRGLHAQLAELAATDKQVHELRSKISVAEGKQKMLKRLQASIEQRSRSELLATIAHCLPPEVWLEKVELGGNGDAVLHGTGLAEEGIFEFVKYLSEAPGFRQVQIEGTSTASQFGGHGTHFDVRLETANFSQTESKGGSKDG